MRSLDIAATGMLAQQLNIDVISNNVANMNTTAYKRQRAEFEDLLYQSQRRVGSNSSNTGTIVPTGIQVGVGVKTGAVSRSHAQGTVENTANSLDVAVQGRGFFTITLPNGELAYTRDGSFQLSPEGEIVTSDGYVVSPGVVIPPDTLDISINEFGEVEVKLDGQAETQNVGQFELTIFQNEAGLEALGGNILKETEASGDPIVGIPGEDGVGTILQGFIENSNVDPVTEITKLITAQRAYEMNSKLITASDEMLQTVNNTKR